MLVSLKGDTDMQEKIVSVLNEMAEYLSISQMKKLQEVIIRNFAENEAKKKEITNEEYFKFLLLVGRRGLYFKKSNEKNT